MKITGFNPLILSPKAEDAVKVLEELGFKKTHAPVTETETAEILTVRMKNEGGFHIDVSELKSIEKDMMFIRMNVDNFDEAYAILTARGFKNTRGDNTLNTKHAKSATMVSPSGFTIALVEHIKK